MPQEKPEKDTSKDAQTPMHEKTPEDLREVAAGIPTPYHRVSEDPDMPQRGTNNA